MGITAFHARERYVRDVFFFEMETELFISPTQRLRQIAESRALVARTEPNDARLSFVREGAEFVQCEIESRDRLRGAREYVANRLYGLRLDPAEKSQRNVQFL